MYPPPDRFPGSVPLVPAERSRPDGFREQLIASLGRLAQLARTLTRTAADAEDLLQATCLRALERGPGLRNHANVTGWLARVMRNLQIDQARSPARRTAALPSDNELAGQAAERIPLWRQVADEDVEHLVPTLSPQLRTVWHLHHGEGLDQNEIATRLRIPRATVATRVFRARAALRQQLTAMYEEHTGPSVAPRPTIPGARQVIAPAAPTPPRPRPARHSEPRPATTPTLHPPRGRKQRVPVLVVIPAVERRR
jgi:RNA polymerase sigma-70 factor (ECF subfamily)